MDAGLGPDPLTERILELSLTLSVEAIQALRRLAPDHAWELLDAVKAKVDGGHIKNPSNYISATIARGYVPQADGGAMVASIARSEGRPPPAAAGGGEAFMPANGLIVPPPRGAESPDDLSLLLSSNGFDDAANQLAGSKGMIKAQQAGLSLNDDAVKALLTLPPDHASELLENVADKQGMLRDPSNYIVATVARGFVPKAGPLTVAAAVGNGAGGLPMQVPLVRPVPQQTGLTSLVPADVTPVESRVLEMNAMDLWAGQPITVETLLALRCVSQDQALQLLSSLEAKGRGKGTVSIQNINNYVQAAVVKIKKGMTAENSWMAAGSGLGFKQDTSLALHGQWNYTGNQTRQKARELGLELLEETLAALAKLPLKDSMWLLEAASWLNPAEEDPNDFIHNEVMKMMQGGAHGSASPSPDEALSKRPRWV